VSGSAARQLDLFRYPIKPGWRDRSTSRQAAETIAASAANLRAEVLKLIRTTPGGLTVHEAARRLRRSVPSVQPRFSELVRREEIKPSGQRRKNESGMSAKVWIPA
jgi:hypothetical protein